MRTFTDRHNRNEYQRCYASPFHQEACTNPLHSLIHQRADSRSKKNYNPAACGTKTTFTER